MPQVGESRAGCEIGYATNNKRQYLPCVDWGKLRWVRLVRGKPENSRCKNCALKKIRREFPLVVPSGDKSPHWKGGRYTDKDGYIRVMLASDDLFHSMGDHQGYILEHRLVMARSFNRCLSSAEIVHHKNGVRNDNRLENLELMTNAGAHIREHSGGYKASYEKGLGDNIGEQIRELKNEIRLFRWELRLHEEEARL
jgi:hypothetical protein